MTAVGTAASVSVARSLRRRVGTDDPYLDENFELLDADRSHIVTTPDGVDLAVREVGPEDAFLTVVFVLEVFPVEVTAMLGAAVLVIFGVVPSDGVLKVFSNPAPWTIAAMFIVSGGLVRTGLINSFARLVSRRAAQHKVLVLMSDMVEDNPPYKFDAMRWREGEADALLTELAAKRLIPNLSGVCLYVSGASARSAALAGQIGRFWEGYFTRAGADFDSNRYAHVLLHWPPSKSCRSR